MRELTASEAAVLLSVLSRGAGEANADLGAAGVPTSTFYATRRKLYDDGLLMDRYVPDPWTTGVRSVDCALVRPGPALRARLERTWAADPQTVVLWSGVNVLFGVFFRAEGEAPEVGDGVALSVTAGSGTIPVYFDYSRPWSRFARIERETGYPRPLGGTGAPDRGSSREIVRRLVLRDLRSDVPSGHARRWHASAGLSRGETAALDRGIVLSRSFLNLDMVPAYEARELGEVVFLTGRLRRGAAARDVLATLHNDCRVSPLFLASDGTRLLLVALGQVASSVAPRTKLPRAARSVTEALDALLEGLQMTVERSDSLQRPVDQRYDRLFWPDSGTPEVSRGSDPPPTPRPPVGVPGSARSRTTDGGPGGSREAVRERAGLPGVERGTS